MRRLTDHVQDQLARNRRLVCLLMASYAALGGVALGVLYGVI